MQAEPVPPSFQTLVAAALDRVEAESRSAGRRFSVRQLEEAHGISNGTLGQIAKGRRRSVDILTSRKISRALGIPLADILNAQAHPELGDPVGAYSEPASQAMTVAEPSARVFDDAFNGTIHKPSDVAAVLPLLRDYFAEYPEVAGAKTDAVQIVRRWLDAAARIRQRGEKPAPARIVAELTARILQLEAENGRPKSSPKIVESSVG